MNHASLTLIIIAFATNGLSDGVSNDEHCDDPLLCVEKPPNYYTFEKDMEEFARINKNNILLEDMISVNHFDESDEKNNVTYPIISGDEENCRTITTLEKPFVIKTNVSTEYVLQLKYFEQKIKITRCLNAQSSCFSNVITPGFGVEKFCQEKLSSVSLYIYDPTQKKLKFKTFEVPVCCVCMFRKMK